MPSSSSNCWSTWPPVASTSSSPLHLRRQMGFIGDHQWVLGPLTTTVDTTSRSIVQIIFRNVGERWRLRCFFMCFFWYWCSENSENGVQSSPTLSHKFRRPASESVTSISFFVSEFFWIFRTALSTENAQRTTDNVVSKDFRQASRRCFYSKIITYIHTYIHTYMCM